MDTAISQLVAPSGVNHASIMAFMREQSTSVARDLLENFSAWVASERTAGRPIDEKLVEQVEHDLLVHHRLTPETISNAPHAPYVSLDHTEAQHFER